MVIGFAVAQARVGSAAWAELGFAAEGPTYQQLGSLFLVVAVNWQEVGRQEVARLVG